MKIHILKTVLLILSYFISASSYSFAEEPSIDMYISSWKNSFPVSTHGTMVERPILTKGDPLNPLTQLEIEDKFRSLASPMFQLNGANKIIDEVYAVDKKDNIMSLVGSLISK